MNGAIGSEYLRKLFLSDLVVQISDLYLCTSRSEPLELLLLVRLHKRFPVEWLPFIIFEASLALFIQITFVLVDAFL